MTIFREAILIMFDYYINMIQFQYRKSLLHGFELCKSRANQGESVTPWVGSRRLTQWKTCTCAATVKGQVSHKGQSQGSTQALQSLDNAGHPSLQDVHHCWWFTWHLLPRRSYLDVFQCRKYPPGVSTLLNVNTVSTAQLCGFVSPGFW